MELSKTRLNLYASLGSAKMRRRHGLFVVEGYKCISDTLKGYTLESLVAQKGCTSNMAQFGCPVYEVTPEHMQKISNLSAHSDMIGIFRLKECGADVDLKVSEGLYVVLDGVQDPGNLGTIVRTCHWFGIFRIFASKDTVDIFNPKTVQATMGSIGSVDVTYCNLHELFDANRDMPVYGTMLEGEDVFATKLSKRGFIVMGNEGKGIRNDIKSCITKPLFIPPATSDHSESLNVSIATAIIISQIVKP